MGSVAAAYIAYKASQEGGRIIETASYEAQIGVEVASEGSQNITRKPSEVVEGVIQATGNLLTLALALTAVLMTALTAHWASIYPWAWRAGQRGRQRRCIRCSTAR